jgi:predicted secreted protein
MASKLLLLIMSLFVLFNFPLVGSVETSAVVWSRTYGGVDSDRVNTIIQAIDGGYALAGATQSFDNSSNQIWLIKTDSLGNMEWNKTFEDGSANSIVQTGDGGYVIAGSTGSFGAGGSDFWLVKTDSEGNMQWSQIYSRHDTLKSVIQTNDGGYALVGTSIVLVDNVPTDNDAWFIKTAPDGTIPEFPSWMPLLILLSVVMVIAFVYKRNLWRK